MRSSTTGASTRSFSVGDGLILIAALAAGLALVRGWNTPAWFTRFVGRFGPQPQMSFARRVHDVTALGVSWTIPFAEALTVAWLAIRLRRPRPSLRRVARQPGTVACVAALAAIGFWVGEEVYCWILGYLTRPQSLIHLPSPPFMRYDNPGYHPPAEQWVRDALLERFPNLIARSVTLAVAAGWSTLAMSGRWRPESGWIDRSGRYLGAYWIALGVLIVALTEINKFLS